MARKQITAVNNLAEFINKGKDTVPLSKHWHLKFRYFTKHQTALIKLPSTCQETQNIMSFLINSMKQIRAYNRWLEEEVIP